VIFVKLSDIRTQINLDIDESYDNVVLNNWINRALDDLTSVAKREAKATLTSPYTLPTDLHEIVYVIQDGQTLEEVAVNDPYTTGYELWGNSLTLQHTSDSPIDLYYFKRLTKLTNDTDVPEIEEEFHDLLILYALGHIQFEDEDYDDRPDALGRYQARKQEYRQYIQKKRSIGRVNKKVVW
jgi:hypothetical protein